MEKERVFKVGLWKSSDTVGWTCVTSVNPKAFTNYVVIWYEVFIWLNFLLEEMVTFLLVYSWNYAYVYKQAYAPNQPTKVKAGS